LRDFIEISNYYLIDIIYETSTCKIYLGRSKKRNLKKILKVKILGEEIQTKIPFIQDISENIQICKNLKHSNIIKIYEGCETEKKYHYSSEYILGKNLTEIVQRCTTIKRNITTDQALNILNKLCDAAIYIKNFSIQNNWDGFSFCNIAPSQILFSYEGEIKLNYPSISGILHHRYKTKILDFNEEYCFYSPAYLENYTNTDITVLYSLGSIIYYIIYGKSPFQGKTTEELRKNVNSYSKDILFPASRKLLPELEDIILMSLNVHPDNNFKILEDLSKGIKTILSPESTSNMFNLSYFMYDIFYEEAQKETNILEEIESMEIPSSKIKKAFEGEITDEGAVIEELVNLGLDHYGKGEIDKAIEYWQKVLDINPSHPKALEYLSIAREDSEEVVDAVEFEKEEVFKDNSSNEKSSKEAPQEDESEWKSYVPPDIPEVKLTEQKPPLEEKVRRIDSTYLTIQDKVTSLSKFFGDKYKMFLNKFHLTTPIFVLSILIIISLGIGLFFIFQPSIEEQISDLNNQAIEATNNKNFDNAAKIYEELILLEPDYYENYYNLGLVYKNMGRISKAEDALKRSVEMKNDVIEAHFYLVEIYNSIGAEKKALKHLETIINYEPENIKALDKKAKLYIIINEKLNAAKTYAQLGELLNSRDETSKALDYFKKAAELDDGSPNLGSIYLKMGNILFKKENLIDADEAYRNGISYNYGIPELHYQLGLTRYMLNNLKSAMNSFNEAWIVSNRRMLDALYYKGLVAKTLNEFEEAEISFREYISIKPDNSQVLKELGTTYYKMNNFNSAKTYWKKALDVDSNIAEVHFNFGVLLYNEKNYEGAISEYKDEIVVNDNDPRVYANMGLAYVKLGNYSNAIDVFLKSLEIKPEQARVCAEVGMAYLQIDESQKAIEMLERSLEIKPEQPDIKKLLKKLKR